MDQFDDTPRAPPLKYTAHLGTRWQKEKDAAENGSFDFPGDPKFIGSWILGECIGKGASGRVRIARHRTTRQLAAVKILPIQPLIHSRASLSTQLAKSEKQRLGIDREIIMMRLMEHPNVLRIYDVYEGDTELYLVLEYVEGGELFDFLVNRGRLPMLEALAFFKQIIYGLNYAHTFKIIHRDLKPENILIQSINPPLIKIADWGMAAFAPPKWQLETSCGSPHYASPEIVNGLKYEGTATDIWSCGVILFALLTGRLPFDDKNVRVLLSKVKHGKYEIPSYVDLQARDLLTRMLVVDVEKRISIPEILAHPWFQHPTPGVEYAPAPPVAKLAQPISEPVDDDLLDSLRVVWGRRADMRAIRAELLSPPGQGQLAKAFYFLLGVCRARTLRENGIILDDTGSGLLSPMLVAQDFPAAAAASASMVSACPVSGKIVTRQHRALSMRSPPPRSPSPPGPRQRTDTTTVLGSPPALPPKDRHPHNNTQAHPTLHVTTAIALSPPRTPGPASSSRRSPAPSPLSPRTRPPSPIGPRAQSPTARSRLLSLSRNDAAPPVARASSSSRRAGSSSVHHRAPSANGGGQSPQHSSSPQPFNASVSPPSAHPRAFDLARWSTPAPIAPVFQPLHVPMTPPRRGDGERVVSGIGIGIGMEGPGGGGGGGTQPVLTLDHHHTGWSPTGTRHVHGHAHGYDTSMGTSSAVGDEWVSIESMDVDDMPPGDMRSMPEYDVEHRVHDAYGHGHGYGREMPSHLGHGQGKEKERKGRNFMETFSPERLRYSVQADKENASGGNLRHSGRGLGLSADGRAVLARANTSRVGRELRNTMYEEEQQGGFAGAGTGKRGETGVAKPRSRGRAHTDYDPHHAKRGAPYDHARTHTTHGGGQPPTPSIGGNVPTPMSPPGTSSSTRDGAGSGLLGAPVGEVRGWFASLFHWRSHSFTLGSIGSPLATRVEAIRVLHTLGADVRPDAHSDALSATGILRCAVGDVRFRAEVIERGGPGNETPSAASTTYYTPSGGIAYAPTPMPVPTPMPTPNANYSMSTTPLIAQSPTHATYTPGPTPTPSLNASAAAFTPALGQRAGASLAKVLADDTHMCALVLVHEKGPVSGFRTVCKRLREEWTLAPHNYGHGVSSPEASAGSQRVSVVSPTFSPGGGFAEQQGAARRVLV